MIQAQNNSFEQENQYQVWVQNTPIFYDRLAITPLSLPSLAFSWLQQKRQTSQTITYSYVYSTNSSGEQQEYIYFAEMEFPKFKNIHSQQASISLKNDVVFQIQHPAEANRLIRSPYNPQQIVTKTTQGPINIYEKGKDKPIKILQGHEQQGYGIDWKSQGLVSSAYDGRVLVWKDPYNDSNPTFEGDYRHDQKIGDCKWIDENIFISVQDDGFMSLWDVRSKDSLCRYQWSDRQLNCVDINPFQKQIVLVGTAKGIVQIWDLRSNMQTLHQYDNHTDSVIRVEWSPHNAHIFMSGSVDSKVSVWDVLKVGSDTSNSDKLQQKNQLMFTHEGHKGPVSDLNWNPYQSMIGSVQQRYNTLQFYQIPQLNQYKYNTESEYQKKSIFQT